MPVSKHRRRGKSRLRDRNQGTAEYRLSPELARELELLRQFLRLRHGGRQPSDAELEDAITSLSGQLPTVDRLLHDLDHNDPDGSKARLILAIARA
jgi:hypothetical protein